MISTEDPERAAALYGARLGLDMALDRSHQEWGQLMFFRCGDLIVEVVQRPVAGNDKANDKLWGLSWRVADIEATRARLLAAGIDVSEVRTGRKPGTRVMSVRQRHLRHPHAAAGADGKGVIFSFVIPGRPKGEPGISRFRVRYCASPRNDG